jgi:hypothetical protein
MWSLDYFIPAANRKQTKTREPTIIRFQTKSQAACFLQREREFERQVIYLKREEDNTVRNKHS